MIERRDRIGFSVERHGEGDGTFFVYQGAPLSRLELWPQDRRLELAYYKLADHSHYDDLLETLWQLCPPGVVDAIDVVWSPRADETSTERQR